jgi:hypothetical protein
MFITPRTAPHSLHSNSVTLPCSLAIMQTSVHTGGFVGNDWQQAIEVVHSPALVFSVVAVPSIKEIPFVPLVIKGAHAYFARLQPCLCQVRLRVLTAST